MTLLSCAVCQGIGRWSRVLHTVEAAFGGPAGCPNHTCRRGQGQVGSFTRNCSASVSRRAPSNGGGSFPRRRESSKAGSK